MQAVNNAHQNANDFVPNTSHESLYSGSFSNSLATSEDFLVPTKTLFDSEYLTFTSNELQNVQLKPTNFAQNMEMPNKCLVCGFKIFSHYDVSSCKGCKMFFRRSLLTSKTYVCKLNGMCSGMNGLERCRACRFDRCVLIGYFSRVGHSQERQVFRLLTITFLISHTREFLIQAVQSSCFQTGPVFEETIEDKTIQSLVYVELKIRKIRESSRCPSESVLCKSFRELLESNHENVLAHADQYPKALKWPLSIDEALKFEESKRRPDWLVTDIFLCIGMARTMPVFSQLEYKDQEALLKQVILANALLLQAFYSYQMKSETFIMPNGFLPSPKVYGTERIAEKVKLFTCGTMGPLSRIQMTMEEFVLLKAVIYSHSAIHGLSERGRVLLEEESVRYSKTLMKHLQSRMGAAPGAKKYAEIISAVGDLFHAGQQLRQMFIYISSVARAKFVENKFPTNMEICCPPYMETIMYAYFV
ncbi:ligand-binding domain of nuclear hormone receptor domain-containing protein [Ditylenchus destructor]|nr:ligand-binding domain of nuclear hormone receptor domain-containing protein [Ditylenchus destructor]